MRIARIAGCVLAGALAAGATAVKAEGPREIRGHAPGQFDFYVLALSWSPGFCALEGPRRDQCEPGRRLGFVVHGLWPQFERGYPAHCRPMGGSPSSVALEEARGLFPDDRLARHQWHKHGSCTSLSPADYFRAARQARERVQIPAELAEPASDVKALPFEIERAFAAANPGLRPDMMAVECRRRIFHEIRICLDRDLRGFRACPEVDRSGCRAGEIAIGAVR